MFHPEKPNLKRIKIMIHKKIFTVLLTAVAGSLLHGQTLLYEFQFNDPANGTNTVGTGNPGGTAAFTNNNNVDHDDLAADLHGSAGSGVSGSAGDYAFDNTVSSQMGGNNSNPGYGGIASITNGALPLDGMGSFTVSGWYSSSSTIGNYARLIEVGSTGVWFQGSTLQLSTNVTGGSGQKLASGDNSLLTTNTWHFFAFTYDGATGTATLYAGTDADSVGFIVSDTLASGDVSLGSGVNLAIGNSNFNDHQRPFDGLLDNYRVWASEDSSGALSMSALEAVRAGDVIPEPSTYAALLGLSVLALSVLRRRR